MAAKIGDILQMYRDTQFGFKYRELTITTDQAEQRAQVISLTHNAIFFQLEGELLITWGEHKDVRIRPGELYFLPRGANVSACVIGKKVRYIAVRLDYEIEDTRAFRVLLRHERCNESISYKLAPLTIKEPLHLFLDSIRYYIVEGIEDQQLQNAKLIELYILFRSYYTKEECVGLFYPILKKNSKFKTYILDNYHVSVTIEELARNANMSRSTFDRNFKEAFGMTPHRWLEIQTRIIIMRKASEPNVTVKDMMYEVGLHNPSQFTQLCRRLCGVAPSQLLKQ